MRYYTNNSTDTPALRVGTLDAPYYWWEAGALWGGMIDYWAYTNDSSYNPTVTRALLAQAGPGRNFFVPEYRMQIGNDDQGFWALAAMSALETRFPNPPPDQPRWLALAEAVFDDIAGRWDTGSCAGGLKWQVAGGNPHGYEYKNAVSNGALFQLAARLFRYTGNATYAAWAARTWDWSARVGLIDAACNVYDGTDDAINCTAVNHVQWSYNVAIFLHGAAALYSASASSSPSTSTSTPGSGAGSGADAAAAELWSNRTRGLFAACGAFFSPHANPSDVMYEAACELAGTCNTDQLSFKAYLARWLGKSGVLAPFLAPSVQALLERSAGAAAASCAGGAGGATCGSRWWTGGWDGTDGVGQQLSALEVVQGLLAARAGPPAVMEKGGSGTAAVV